MNARNIFEIQMKPDFVLIRFFGYVDAASVEQLKPALHSQIPPHAGNIAVDLSAVTFLDSHGIGLFVSFLKQAHRNKGKLVICGSEGQPASVLQMVGFNGGLVTYCDKADAIAGNFSRMAG